MATATNDLPEIKNILTKLENNIGIACQQISGEIINLLSSYYYDIGKKNSNLCANMSLFVFKMLSCVSHSKRFYYVKLCF